ncbi:MAG: hypothetical protein AVDCRST_MAG93-3613 [uncultured Chloroflexia bacterium]|uniref:Uncharacterized protein n=1 Tax=uncultured Chloroflexia bacterium TaxID=1672391 RepID=A0A6J4JTQ3_9CHLR|nr:MAG: hypothetical protein AVDCRST_MAG93-3613 [uncultured Chloroflexia bacterium]
MPCPASPERRSSCRVLPSDRAAATGAALDRLGLRYRQEIRKPAILKCSTLMP